MFEINLLYSAPLRDLYKLDLCRNFQNAIGINAIICRKWDTCRQIEICDVCEEKPTFPRVYESLKVSWEVSQINDQVLGICRLIPFIVFIFKFGHIQVEELFLKGMFKRAWNH